MGEFVGSERNQRKKGVKAMKAPTNFLLGFVWGVAITIAVFLFLLSPTPSAKAKQPTVIGSDATGTIYEGAYLLTRAPLPCERGDLYFDTRVDSLKRCKTDWGFADSEDWKRYWSLKNAQLEQEAR